MIQERRRPVGENHGTIRLSAMDDTSDGFTEKDPRGVPAVVQSWYTSIQSKYSRLHQDMIYRKQ